MTTRAEKRRESDIHVYVENDGEAEVETIKQAEAGRLLTGFALRRGQPGMVLTFTTISGEED